LSRSRPRRNDHHHRDDSIARLKLAVDLSLNDGHKKMTATRKKGRLNEQAAQV
jgi:hypothetical protein